jgi:hypothetical protein
MRGMYSVMGDMFCYVRRVQEGVFYSKRAKEYEIERKTKVTMIKERKGKDGEEIE